MAEVPEHLLLRVQQRKDALEKDRLERKDPLNYCRKCGDYTFDDKKCACGENGAHETVKPHWQDEKEISTPSRPHGVGIFEHFGRKLDELLERIGVRTY